MLFEIKADSSQSGSTTWHGNLTIEANSPMNAGRKAREQIRQIVKDQDGTVGGSITVFAITWPAAKLDPLAQLIHAAVQYCWLYENPAMVYAGFSADKLSGKIEATQAGSGPGITYTTPGADAPYEVIRESFPSEITPFIRPAVSKFEDAMKLVERVVGRLSAESFPVADGDHHSPTYGEEIFRAYKIKADEAFALVCGWA